MTDGQALPESRSANGLTIVVPVYADADSLSRCLESLVAYTVSTRDRVILVNDCGPDADLLEAAIKPYVTANSNFAYFRNPRNVGFVATCNRAVLELDNSSNDVLLLNSDAELTAGAIDELLDVLYLSERHGVVCPRSNYATIATIPARSYRASDRDGNPAHSHAIFTAVSNSLPRYYVSPVSIGFCYLIRRELIENHGLFDEVFGVGYDEENDLCMRVNQLGYSSLIANHAFVFHVGGASFGEEAAPHRQANSVLLRKRYPYFDEAVNRFARFGYSAIDNFAAFVTADSGPRKILLDVHHLAHAYNGSTKNVLTFLEYVASLDLNDSIEITIAAQADSIEVFDLPAYGFRTVQYETVDELFDLGIALSPVTSFAQLEQLNRNCVRLVVCHLDIIALRTWALSIADPGRHLAVRDSLIYADRVVTISASTWRDTIAYFPGLERMLQRPATVVHQGSPRDALVRRSEPDFGDEDARAPDFVAELKGFVLIVGNAFPHKQVKRAVQVLSGHGLTLVALSSLKGVPRADDVIVLGSGHLSESTVAGLYKNAGVVLFPSAYEGYGLPLAESLDHGTPVVVFDTEVTREVTESLGASDSVIFFNRFGNLLDTVNGALGNENLKDNAKSFERNTPTIGEFNKKLWSIALETLAQPFDFTRLKDRYDEVQRISYYAAPIQAENAALHKAIGAIRGSRSYRIGNAIVRVLSTVVSPIRRLVRSSADRSDSESN